MILQLTDPFHRHHDIEALLRGGEVDLTRTELRRFGEAVGENQRLRVAYLRAQAVLEVWGGDTGVAVEHLQEAETLATEIGLPGELWQVQATLGELQEELGEASEASGAFELAAGTIRDLADRIGDENLGKDLLTASQARRVLEKAHRANPDEPEEGEA